MIKDREKELKRKAIEWFYATHRTYKEGRLYPYPYCVLDEKGIAIITDRESAIVAKKEDPNVMVRVSLPFTVVGCRENRDSSDDYIERQ